MATTMAALKVKIGIKANGDADYPNFNTLQAVKDAGADWANYIENPAFGFGWNYDKKYGHRDIGPDSPAGMQWGVILVNETFADQAVAAFPDVCSKIDDSTMGTFYEERVTLKEDDEKIDQTALQGLREELKLREALGVPVAKIKQRIARAINPDNPEPGITRNVQKTWAGKKTKDDIVIR